MNWGNVITEKLQIKYPIIQAPMFGVATPAMVAAASEANCLGSLPLADLSAEKSIELIRATKQLTSKNFSINIFAHNIPPITPELKEKYSVVKLYLEQLARENKIDVILPDIEDLSINSYHEQIDAIIEERCKIVSFTFGNLDDPSITKLKNENVFLIGTCTSVEEAIVLDNSGIDIICVQGIEAGGHRGSFTSDNIAEIGGISLLSQVREQVSVPIIYAGGIYNAKTLLASRIIGADAYQVGSMLLISKESALNEFEKSRIKHILEEDIVLTKSFSGRYARGIRNKFIDTTENSEYILPYPYQNKLTNALRSQAKVDKNVDFVSIWLGQSIHNYSTQSTTNILQTLIADVEKFSSLSI